MDSSLSQIAFDFEYAAAQYEAAMAAAFSERSTHELARSIQAAIRAKSPIVGIPLPGKRPLVFRRTVLAGALSGVDPTTIFVEESENGERVLNVFGRAGERVRTRLRMRSSSAGTARTEILEYAAKIRQARKVSTISSGNAKTKKYDAAIAKLERAIQKLGAAPSLPTPWEQVRFHRRKPEEVRPREAFPWMGDDTYAIYVFDCLHPGHREWLRWRAEKPMRRKVGKLAFLALNGKIDNRTLYAKLAALELNVKKFGDLRTHERDVAAGTFSGYLKKLRYFCGLSLYNPLLDARGRKFDYEPVWGSARYKQRLEWIAERKSLLAEIEAVKVMREEALEKASAKEARKPAKAA